jgi:hypothetical protein
MQNFFQKLFKGVLKSQRMNEMVGDIAHCCAVPENREGTVGKRYTRDVTGYCPEARGLVMRGTVY